jgi:outer membrane protein assembly factor BamB
MVPLSTAQHSLENFASGIAAADGKVFTIDAEGNVNCFDAQTGAQVWSNVAGGYSLSNSITVYNGVVYAATKGGVLVSLNENTGKVLLHFEAPVDSSIGSKTPPTFYSVGGGFVFVASDGFAVYNVRTGKLIWEIPESLPSTTVAIWPYENNVFLGEGVQGGPASFYRVNPENGSALWYAPGVSSSPPLYYNGQIILWNEGSTYPGGQNVISVNASSGTVLWNFDVGFSIYQPTISDGLLLFGATDGNFYALNLSDGNLAWKTHVDAKEYMARENLTQANFTSAAAASPVQVNTQNKTAFWGFAITQSGINGQNGNNQYVGSLCGLNLTSGQILWSCIIGNSGDAGSVGLAGARNVLYLTTGTDLWRIDESTGAILGTTQFYHYVLPPVETDNNVAVAADLYLITYGSPESPNSPLLIVGVAIAIVAVVVSYLILRKRLKKGDRNGAQEV